ncbi:MAG: two-component system sensor histidine kinase NtrB [Promethearchaeota archaeon]
MITDRVTKPGYNGVKKMMFSADQKQLILTRMILTLVFAVGINIVAVLLLPETGGLFSRVNGFFIGITFILLNGLIGIFNRMTRKKRSVLDSPDRRNVEAFSLLAGGIAHDFNNILTTISGCLSISLLDLAPGTELQEDLVTALKATERASKLTSQLLRFSKGGEPIKKSASLQDIITDSTRFVLAGSGVAVEFNFPEKLPEIQIDPDQISQVIQNIVLNGKQAMKNQGHITVTVEISTNIISKQDTTYLCISIADSGPGIAPSIRHKIMQPYFTTKTKGNGLGLASSVNIIKNHHGMMDFSSVVGQGTVFRIYLPVES